MRRHLSRVGRRSLADSHTATITLDRGRNARKNALAERTQSSQAFLDSRGYGIKWRNQTVSGYAKEIIHELRFGEKGRASKMLSNIDYTNHSFNADTFACILEYCAERPDPVFAMETWRFMEEKSIAISKRCCRAIIQAFSRGGYLKEAYGWLTYLLESGYTQAILPMYNIVLSGCGKRQSLVDAERCLGLMESQCIGKSEITYWELLKLAVLQNNLSAAREIWEDYLKYYDPSIIMLRKFIWSFTRLGCLQSAFNALQHMVALASPGSASVGISVAGQYRSLRLDIPIPTKNDLPVERFHFMNNSCSSYAQNVGSSIEGNEDLGANSICLSIGEKQPPFKFSKNPKQDRFVGDLSWLSQIAGTVQFRTLPGVKDGINSEMPPPILNSVVLGRQDAAIQKECTDFVLDVRKQQDLGLDLSVPIKNLLRWSFNDLIHASAKSKNCELAEQLIFQMTSLGCEPTEHTFDGFVKAVINGKGVSYAVKVIGVMEKNNIPPYNDTLAALSIALSKNLELQSAEVLLERISDNLPKYIHPFNAFFAGCRVMDEPERAVRVLAKMKRLDIKPTIRTYELLFSLFGNVNVPYEKGNMLSHVDVAKRIAIIEKDMMKSGIQHSFVSMKNLVRALGAEGMIKEMLQYLNVAENMIWHTNSYQRTSMYNYVLHALVKAKESQTAVEVFKSMRSYGFPANVAIYNIMIECCGLLMCFRSAKAIISMMLRDGFSLQAWTYTSLMKVILVNGDFDQALSLLDQPGAEGVQTDIQMYNTILKEAYLKGRIDIIESIIELIHTEKIKPDPSTCWYVFSAYVESDFHSTAMEALQVLSMRMISEESSVLQETRASYEDLLYNEDHNAESQIIEIFIDSQEFLATALLNLRMCAITGFSISWCPEENPWARRLSSLYSAGK